MFRANVSMNVRKGSDTISIIDVEGEFTGFAEDALMEAYSQAGAGNARAIILNFAGLEYMNSSGIGLLATLLIRMNRQGQRLSVVGLSEHYRHIFELTRLDEAISIYESEAEALEHLDV